MDFYIAIKGEKLTTVEVVGAPSEYEVTKFFADLITKGEALMLPGKPGMVVINMRGVESVIVKSDSEVARSGAHKAEWELMKNVHG